MSLSLEPPSRRSRCLNADPSRTRPGAEMRFPIQMLNRHGPHSRVPGFVVPVKSPLNGKN